MGLVPFESGRFTGGTAADCRDEEPGCHSALVASSELPSTVVLCPTTAAAAAASISIESSRENERRRCGSCLMVARVMLSPAHIASGGVMQW